MSDILMLTTIDNPYNPHTNWDEWYSYDISKGYNTCGYLARLAVGSDSLTDIEKRQLMRKAMTDIIAHNVLYRMIGPADIPNPISADDVLESLK